MRTFHLRIALPKAAVVQLHALVTSGLTTTLPKRVLGAKGFFVDFLQRYSKSEQSVKVFH